LVGNPDQWTARDCWQWHAYRLYRSTQRSCPCLYEAALAAGAKTKVRPVLDLNTGILRLLCARPDGHKVEAAFGMSSLLTIPRNLARSFIDMSAAEHNILYE